MGEDFWLMKLTTTMYIHGTKEGSIEVFEQLCEENNIEPSEEACTNAMYALYEIALEVEFDTDTGNSKVIGFRET